MTSARKIKVNLFALCARHSLLAVISAVSRVVMPAPPVSAKFRTRCLRPDAARSLNRALYHRFGQIGVATKNAAVPPGQDLRPGGEPGHHRVDLYGSRPCQTLAGSCIRQLFCWPCQSGRPGPPVGTGYADAVSICCTATVPLTDA